MKGGVMATATRSPFISLPDLALIGQAKQRSDRLISLITPDNAGEIITQLITDISSFDPEAAYGAAAILGELLRLLFAEETVLQELEESGEVEETITLMSDLAKCITLGIADDSRMISLYDSCFNVMEERETKENVCCELAIIIHFAVILNGVPDSYCPIFEQRLGKALEDGHEKITTANLRAAWEYYLDPGEDEEGEE